MLTLIIDADDTLWENNIYYEECVEALVGLLETEGYERQEILGMVSRVEEERVPQVGYAPQEFVRSLVIAYERLCRRHVRQTDSDTEERVREIGSQVLAYPIVLLEGVEETLQALDSRHRLILLTKGDDEVQRDKLARSGLVGYFEEVHVVAEKDADVFRNLIAEYNLHPERTWMIGNSPRSDVNPAVEAGIGGVYVPHPNTWELEIEGLVPSERVTVLERFADLPQFVAQRCDNQAEAV